MTSRGPKHHADRPVRWELSIPLSLAAEVEILLADPVRGTTPKGARSRLVQRLLREFLETAGAKPQLEEKP